MEITIKGTPKEIADLLREIESRQEKEVSECAEKITQSLQRTLESI